MKLYTSKCLKKPTKFNYQIQHEDYWLTTIPSKVWYGTRMTQDVIPTYK